MTPKEFYEWAVDMDAENYDIQIEWEGDYAFTSDAPEENQLSISRSREQIIFNI